MCRGSGSLGNVDLPDFVTASVAAETGRRAASRGVIHLPADWAVGLDGLPGFDREHRLLRFTRDHARLRDSRARPLGFIGRAHPLVQRAITRLHRLAGAPWDNRVSVARADAGAVAALLTFSGEMRNAVRTEFRCMIAILLPECGDPSEMSEPEGWLRHSASDRSVACDDAWQRWFAHWLPDRQREAEAIARAAMHRDAAAVIQDHRRGIDREAHGLENWIRLRADDICGAFAPQTGDLFGADWDGAVWRSLPAPIDRLAAFTADPDNPPARRREANSVVELFQRRTADRAARTTLSSPVLQLIGMLMLVPAA
jgi:hypothetical protein